MISLAVLAGGRSSRLGTEKGLHPFRGKPLVVHPLECLASLANEIFIVSDRVEAYRFLGFPVFPDLHPGLGPLGGLYSALSHARNPLVALVACDMPHADAALFSHLLFLMRTTPADATVPSTSHGLEPLHAIYRVSCLPAIEKSIAAGQHALIGWFSQAQVTILTPHETQAHTSDPQAFLNLNEPDQFARAA